MRFSLIVAAAIMLAACQTTQTSAPTAQQRGPKPEEATTPHVLTPAERERLETALKNELKDPGSAIFGKSIAVKGESGLIYVCGYINAKNSYGGYVGNKPYYAFVTEKGAAVLTIGGTGTSTDVAYIMCEGAGLDIRAL